MDSASRGLPAGTNPGDKQSLTIAQAADRISGHTLGSIATSTFYYSFMQSEPHSGDDVEEFNPFNEQQKIQAVKAMDSWSDVSGVKFILASSDSMSVMGANIAFGNYVPPADRHTENAFTDYAGNLFVNSSKPEQASPSLFNDGRRTLVHEIGHVIGLDHPSDYDLTHGSGPLTYSNKAEYVEDTRQYSVMSYFNSTGVVANDHNFNGLMPAGPMLDDIAAIQSIHGVNNSTRLSNTTYGYNASADTLDYHRVGERGVVFAAWDAGGFDTFDFSKYAGNQVIDLREGNFSSVAGGKYNVAIAIGATIEAAKGGSGGNQIYGNHLDNTIWGGSGVDIIYGLDGDDTIHGSLGNDTISGGLGKNTLIYEWSSINAIHVSKDHVSTDMNASWNSSSGAAYLQIQEIRATIGSDVFEIADMHSMSLFGLDGTDTFNVKSVLVGTTITADGGDKIDTIDFNKMATVTPTAAVSYDMTTGVISVSDQGSIKATSIETIDYAGLAASITGTNRNDDIKTSTGTSTIDAGAGNDVITALALHDPSARHNLNGGSGSDIITAHGASDIQAGSGMDVVYGSSSSDTIHMGQTVSHQENGVLIIDELDNDQINAGRGNDVISGLSGHDYVDGGDGMDMFEITSYGQDLSYSLVNGSLNVARGVDWVTMDNVEYIKMINPFNNTFSLISTSDIMSALKSRTSSERVMTGDQIDDYLNPLSKTPITGDSGNDTYFLNSGDIIKGNGGSDTYHINTSIGGKISITDFKPGDSLYINGNTYTGRIYSDWQDWVFRDEYKQEQYDGIKFLNRYDITEIFSRLSMSTGFTSTVYETMLIARLTDHMDPSYVVPGNPAHIIREYEKTIGLPNQIYSDKREYFDWDNSHDVGMITFVDNGKVTELVLGNLSQTGLIMPVIHSNLSYDGYLAEGFSYLDYLGTSYGEQVDYIIKYDTTMNYNNIIHGFENYLNMF